MHRQFDNQQSCINFWPLCLYWKFASRPSSVQSMWTKLWIRQSLNPIIRVAKILIRTRFGVTLIFMWPMDPMFERLKMPSVQKFQDQATLTRLYKHTFLPSNQMNMMLVSSFCQGKCLTETLNQYVCRGLMSIHSTRTTSLLDGDLSFNQGCIVREMGLDCH